MNGGGIKHYPGTIVIGPNGQRMATRGYTEIAGMRIYDDQIIIGDHGEYVIRKGETEFLPESK